MNLIDFIPHATPYTFEVKNATVIWLSFVQKAAEQYLGGWYTDISALCKL